MKRAMIFIDYKNLVSSDYKIDIFRIPFVVQDRLFNILGTDIDLIKTHVFMGNPATPQQEGFVDAMVREHFEVVFQHQTNKDKIYHEKGIDVSLACRMVALAHQDAYDIAVLITGDADLHPAVREVQKIGRRVLISCFEDRISSIYKEPNRETGPLDFDIFYLDEVISAITTTATNEEVTPESILEEIVTDFFDGNIDFDHIRIKRFITYWATRARYLQDQSTLSDDDKETIKSVFDQLNKLSAKHRPGYVKALNRDWSPTSWEEEIKRIPRSW